MRTYFCLSTLVVVAGILFFIAGLGNAESRPVFSADAPMEMLVSADWLSRHLQDPDLVVLDCTVKIEQTQTGGMRAVNGRPAYDAGHIPGAGFADLIVALSDTNQSIDYALPAPEKFCQVMGRLGVGDNTRVVLYDSSNSVWAARVWWMLRWVGFDKAALLDGGLKAWQAGNRPVSTDPAGRPARKLTPAVRPELIADRDEVLAAIDDDKVHLVDAMPEPVYSGQMNMYARPGHIKGAMNIPVMNLFDQSGRFKSLEELAALHPEDRSRRYITYCGAGIAASGSAFAMVRLGFKNVAVYTASLQEWAADPANPMVDPTP